MGCPCGARARRAGRGWTHRQVVLLAAANSEGGHGSGAGTVKILAVNAISFVGGAERWLLHLVRSLAPRGHRLDVAHDPRAPRAGGPGGRRR